MARKRGRPSIVDDDEQMETRRSKLYAFLRQGASYRAAANAAGIGASTFMRAMQQGKRQKRGKYRDFRDQVIRCMDESRVLVETRLFGHTKKNPRAAIMMLRNRYPLDWNPEYVAKLMAIEAGMDDRTPEQLPTVRVRRETAGERDKRHSDAQKEYNERKAARGSAA